VSLLKTKFFLWLQSGDSVGYDKILESILGELQPENKANLEGLNLQYSPNQIVGNKNSMVRIRFAHFWIGILNQYAWSHR